jgi:hypothetical protein
MELIEHQKYQASLDYVGSKLLEWSDMKPDNKDLKNLIRCMSTIGLYVNELKKENAKLNSVSEKNVDKFRDITKLIMEEFDL